MGVPSTGRDWFHAHAVRCFSEPAATHRRCVTDRVSTLVICAPNRVAVSSASLYAAAFGNPEVHSTVPESGYGFAEERDKRACILGKLGRNTGWSIWMHGAFVVLECQEERGKMDSKIGVLNHIRKSASPSTATSITFPLLPTWPLSSAANPLSTIKPPTTSSSVEQNLLFNDAQAISWNAIQHRGLFEANLECSETPTHRLHHRRHRRPHRLHHLHRLPSRRRPHRRPRRPRWTKRPNKPPCCSSGCPSASRPRRGSRCQAPTSARRGSLSGGIIGNI